MCFDEEDDVIGSFMIPLVICDVHTFKIRTAFCKVFLWHGSPIDDSCPKPHAYRRYWMDFNVLDG